MSLWGSKPEKKVEEPLHNLVGVYETASTFSAVYTTQERDELIVKAQVFQQLNSNDPGMKSVVLQKFVQDNRLQGIPCSYVLSTGDYAINLVESPAVAVNERSKAVSWLIRDLINFPIEEAVIETFELPFPRAKDNLNMLYAVSIQKSFVKKIENFINESELVLTYIDIPELALNNLVNFSSQEIAKGSLIQLNSTGGCLILRDNNKICMIRSFDLLLNDLSTEIGLKSLENLCLEIQKSFDYVDNMFRKNINSVLVLSATSLNMDVIKDFVVQTLGFEVHMLSLDQCLKIEKKMSEEESENCLCAVGATLRGQSFEHEPTNKFISD